MAEPISVAEAKQHLRVLDDTTEDTLIGTYIAAARAWVEDYTSRILVQREIELLYQAWGDYLTVWLQPVVSIDPITYIDADGEEAEFDGFAFASGQYPLRIYPVDQFPTLGDNGFITVPVTAGYEAEAIPEPLIHALKLILTAMFKGRGGTGWDEAEKAAKALCQPYRPPGMA